MNNKKIILSIEGIRGFAAIYVMLGHIVQLYQPYVFFPGLEFVIKTLFGYGHQAVILFFIMSGFSIHYSSSKYNFSDRRQITDYLFKRFRRIYPLFLMALIISFVVLYITQTPSDWVRNSLSFVFLTDISKGCIADPIPTNFPIWSLSYEVIYYLLYPLILWLKDKIGLKRVLIISIIISLIAGVFELSGLQNHLSNVFQLYWIWVVGAVIAEYKMNNKQVVLKYKEGVLMSALAMMFTLEKLTLLRDWAWGLFFSIIIFSFFVTNNKTTGTQKLVSITLSLITILGCYFLTFNDQVLFHPGLVRYILYAFAAGSLVFVLIPFHYFQSLLRLLLLPFIKTGSFSYAVYIFHWPSIILLKYIFQNQLKDSLVMLMTVIVLNIFLVMIWSWYAEVKLQPQVAKVLNNWFYKTHK